MVHLRGLFTFLRKKNIIITTQLRGILKLFNLPYNSIVCLNRISII